MMLNLNNTPSRHHGAINFARINGAALAALPSILYRWLPGGRVEGAEYVARNPRRVDRNLGSFKISLRSGKWSDFATGDSGGDPVSLAAYLANISQVEAAVRVATMLGMEARDA
jgi:hypothetical protein